MKVGLVLEGGGMRGLYTAGVLDAFLEAGIKGWRCFGICWSTFWCQLSL